MRRITNYHHHLPSLSRTYFFRCKRQSSVCLFSSQDDNARNYLEHWAGAGRLKTAATATSSSSSPSLNPGSQSSLQVTGSSYLLATLRLPRHATATSLSSDLESFLPVPQGNGGGATSFMAIHSLLRPKSLLPGSTTSSLRVPIILDLAAFQHDGSPHYKPPCEGFLTSIVETLDKWGISVMGLTNVPQIETVEKEGRSLGLLLLGRVGSGRILGMNGKQGIGTGTGTGGGRDASVSIEDLVQLVWKQSRKNDEEENAARNVDITAVNENNAVEKFDHPVLTSSNSGGDPDHDEKIKISIRDKNILSLSLSDLQKACDMYHLDATEPMSDLYDKILTNNGLQLLQQQRQSTKSDTLNTMIQKDADDNDSPSTSTTTNTAVNIPPPPKIYHGSVRSGQQVSTDEPNQSLVIMGNVNSGGEVIADGNIYIFGHLRGRAIAGLSDDLSSMELSSSSSSSIIVCTHFDAELVCIGESFTTMDGSLEELYGVKNGKGVMIQRRNYDNETGDESVGSSLNFMNFG
mmetsp:Transcript_12374/g.23188  ORF Transcript_12374/g.23188 Transcript_12374/m.23188 type:complete len:519 (-) Transcript_12374:15-1571(-)